LADRLDCPELTRFVFRYLLIVDITCLRTPADGLDLERLKRIFGGVILCARQTMKFYRHENVISWLHKTIIKILASRDHLEGEFFDLLLPGLLNELDAEF